MSFQRLGGMDRVALRCWTRGPETDRMSDPTMDRRAFVGSAARFASLPLVAGGLGAFLAACGQKTESAATNVPTGLATAGSTIPASQLSWAMAPFPDETVAVIAMRRGYFDDVGIKIKPTSTGAKLDLTESLAPLLSKQVDVGSGVIEVFASQLDNTQAARVFLLLDTFEGFALYAPPGSSIKTVDEFVAQGQSFDQALKSAMGQLKGKRVALATDPGARLFYNLLFSVGGISAKDFQRRDLSNPNIVAAALAGKTDIAAPSGGVEVIKLESEGFKLIVNQRQFTEQSNDRRRLQLISHSTYVTRADVLENEYETILRAGSAVFRVLDDLRKDHPAAAGDQLPFLNSYTGTKLTEPQLAKIHKTIARLRTFDEMGDLLTGATNPNNIYLNVQAQIDQLRKDKVLKNPHTVGEVDASRRVWEDLKRYRAESDRLFRALGGTRPDVVAKARKHYDARNYLDSYRFLAAASKA
jgi:ABC-type nitrate/sulfonate/bicarbonate transport system substrate-binding protein